MSDERNPTTAEERPIETAPRDGRWIEVRTIGDEIPYGLGGSVTRQPAWFRMYWWPEGTSWVDGHPDPVCTGVWTDDDGWLQPNEVDAWRPIGKSA